MSTFGPDYDEQRDGKRLSVQLNLVRDVMLAAAIRGEWLSVPQIVVRLQNMHHTRKECTAELAQIPPELANCVADYFERILERRAVSA